jgi:hypothetical protein
MSTKTNSKALDGSGKSLYAVQHEGLEIKGDSYEAIADAVVTSTLFSQEGNYIVKDTTNGDSATISIINTAGTLSAVKVNGSVGITITADNASTLNVYVLAGVLAVQNLTGGAIDFTVKPYV